MNRFVRFTSGNLCRRFLLNSHPVAPRIRIPIRPLTRLKYSSSGLTDSSRISIDSMKKRISKKKSTIDQSIEGLSEKPVVAVSTSEVYKLHKLRKAIIEQGLYEPVNEGDSIEAELNNEVIHFTAKYVLDHSRREFFVFEDGAVVFWNMSSKECDLVLMQLKEFEVIPYDPVVVQQEREEIDVAFVNGQETRFDNGLIHLNVDSNVSASNLEKYAFSNAMALSVKMAMWERKLEEYIENIDYLTHDIEHGRKLNLTRQQVFDKAGLLYTLRHQLNLSSDLLDTPDFYWNRADLEKLFISTRAHFKLRKRITVMNERITYCTELLTLVMNHLNEIHHTSLEKMIIYLIAVEVVFETLPYIERIFFDIN